MENLQIVTKKKSRKCPGPQRIYEVCTVLSLSVTTNQQSPTWGLIRLHTRQQSPTWRLILYQYFYHMGLPLDQTTLDIVVHLFLFSLEDQPKLKRSSNSPLLLPL